MSMPQFPDSKKILTREEAINAILTSIALEEVALSHIINAEGEKIQYVIQQAQKKHGADLNAVLMTNKSVANILEQIKDIQIILKSKLRIAADLLPDNPSPKPPKPKPPVPCTTVFAAVPGFCWMQERTLKLKTDSHCNNEVELFCNNCDWLIKLPPRKTFKIELDLELANKSACPVLVKMVLKSRGEILCTESYSSEGRESTFRIRDKQVWTTSAQNQDNILKIQLGRPHMLHVRGGKIFITELP